MQLTISKDELYTMMKSALRDVLHEDKVERFLSAIPQVSDEEMKDIEESFGAAPDDSNEVVYSETINL